MNRLLFVPIAALALLAAPLQAQLAQDPALKSRVEESVNRGLDYLAETLTEQGSYQANHGQTAAIPALAGLAFLSAGHLPGEGPYGETINRIIDYVLGCAEPVQVGAIQNAAYFGRRDNGRMYAHSIATLFLSETSGMTDPERQEKIDNILPDAVRLILDAQAVKKPDNHAGGWRYEPNSTDSDMSCSGWALMALRSARLNGAPVPDEAIDRAVRYVKRSHNKRDGYFGYQNASEYGVTLTGAGILCLELCGRHNDEDSQRGVAYLKNNYTKLLHEHRALYGLYYTSQGLFQMGGEVWQMFQAWMYDTWIPLQKTEGFWNRNEENCIPYQTAMCILAFTVPYRQLPIYQRDETVDE
ncbi:MAG: prenyltransferase/squalene oxidase repeat-containing protein [Kiritimatiellia bacterium]